MTAQRTSLVMVRLTKPERGVLERQAAENGRSLAAELRYRAGLLGRGCAAVDRPQVGQARGN
jgi:hypothetical protein